jgi:hypothetical protein
MSNPSDLNVVPQPDTDKNYFNFKATNLKINETYAIKFQWVYSDGQLSDWSPGYFVTTSNETSPGVPTGTIVPSTFAGSIPVELPSFPAGARKVDVIVANGMFGTGKIAYTFFSAGKATIAASAGTYVVELRSTNVSGGTSTVGTTHSIIVTDPAANFQVETPTLASGLTVNPAPFAVSVNWAGTYSSADFDGFKSIDIHVRGSDVGSTATAGFSATTQVATLTVTGTTNRQNIGLDNLRQALSLENNTSAYTAPMFFYYITRNSEDTLYSVSGTPTYTRINSSTVNPTQANLVDLVNGVISIENLVAGNGNFSSYLRVGSTSTSGGGRIELSGVNNFTDSLTTRTVKRGITAYDSGNNEVLSFDYGASTPTLAIKGTLTGSTGVFGPVTIGTSGISSTNFSIESDGTATFAGTVTANSGSIGGWKISENAFKSTEVAFPTIELDPVSPKFEIRQSAHASSESGIKVIKIDPTSGIRAGTTSNFKFTVDMDGNMSATDGTFSSGSFNGDITSSATITGGTITGATITTSQNTSYGNTRVRMNSSNATLELLSNGNVYGQLYTFNDGNEVILRHGNTSTLTGFPTSSSFLSLSPTTISLGWNDSVGDPLGGLSLFYSAESSFPFSSVFTGSVQSIGNGSIASPEFRNISAGSAVQSTTSSNNALGNPAYIGDIYIQF